MKGLDAELAALIAEASQILERAGGLPPLGAQEEANHACDRVVEVRDGLIARLRAAPDAADAADRRAALERVNAALSLIAATVYPSSFLRREYFTRAREMLGESSG